MLLQKRKVSMPATREIKYCTWSARQWSSVFIMLFIFEGVVQGLSTAVPLLMQPYGFSYGARGTFSFVWWSYTTRLLAAPLIDSLHPFVDLGLLSCGTLRKISRPAAWVITLQTLGAGALCVAAFVLGPMFTGHKECDITLMTTIFFVLNLLMALHKIAADTWSLDVLTDKISRGSASSLVSIGFTLGSLGSYTLLATVHDRPAPTDVLYETGAHHIFSMKSFMLIWAVLMFLCSAWLTFQLVQNAPWESDTKIEDGRSTIEALSNTNKSASTFATARRRKASADIASDNRMSPMKTVAKSATQQNEIAIESTSKIRVVFEAYKNVLILLRTPAALLLCAFLLSCRAGFAALSSGADMSLMKRGIPLQTLAALQLLYVPLELLVQVYAGRIMSKMTVKHGKTDKDVVDNNRNTSQINQDHTKDIEIVDSDQEDEKKFCGNTKELELSAYMWTVGFLLRIIAQIGFLILLMYLNPFEPGTNTRECKIEIIQGDPTCNLNDCATDTIQFEGVNTTSAAACCPHSFTERCSEAMHEIILAVDEACFPATNTGILGAVHGALSSAGLRMSCYMLQKLIPVIILQITLRTSLILMTIPQRTIFSNVAASSRGLSGSYMTLLNTVANMGALWPTPVVLMLADTAQTCADSNSCLFLPQGIWNWFDGFELVIVASIIYCCIWLVVARPVSKYLLHLPASSWSPIENKLKKNE